MYFQREILWILSWIILEINVYDLFCLKNCMFGFHVTLDLQCSREIQGLRNRQYNRGI